MTAKPFRPTFELIEETCEAAVGPALADTQTHRLLRPDQKTKLPTIPIYQNLNSVKKEKLLKALASPNCFPNLRRDNGPHSRHSLDMLGFLSSRTVVKSTTTAPKYSSTVDQILSEHDRQPQEMPPTAVPKHSAAKQDAATEIDSAICSIDMVETALEELQDSLDLTQEMIYLNQKKQLKDILLQLYESVCSKIKMLNENASVAVQEERLSKERVYDEFMLELQNEHEDHLTARIRNLANQYAAETAAIKKTLHLSKEKLQEAHHEYERFSLKVLKYQSLVQKLKPDEEIFGFEQSLPQLIPTYTSDIEHFTREIDEIKSQLALLAVVDPPPTAAAATAPQQPVSELREHAISHPPSTVAAFTESPQDNYPDDPEIKDTPSLQEQEAAVANPLQFALEQYQLQHNAEINKIRLHREKMCKRWRKKIEIANRQNNVQGLRSSLKLQHRLLSLANHISNMPGTAE
ncbi:hypothetical protein HDV03_004400 [Kappamyces sp. JEL0829]|nr:hypothetical protein HDV03_004400 [Kappamyces sp. JEL0829]